MASGPRSRAVDRRRLFEPKLAGELPPTMPKPPASSPPTGEPPTAGKSPEKSLLSFVTTAGSFLAKTRSPDAAGHRRAPPVRLHSSLTASTPPLPLIWPENGEAPPALATGQECFTAGKSQAVHRPARPLLVGRRRTPPEPSSRRSFSLHHQLQVPIHGRPLLRHRLLHLPPPRPRAAAVAAVHRPPSNCYSSQRHQLLHSLQHPLPATPCVHGSDWIRHLCSSERAISTAAVSSTSGGILQSYSMTERHYRCQSSCSSSATVQAPPGGHFSPLACRPPHFQVHCSASLSIILSGIVGTRFAREGIKIDGMGANHRSLKV